MVRRVGVDVRVVVAVNGIVNGGGVGVGKRKNPVVVEGYQNSNWK
jgi:hypothetical protein